MPEQVQAGCACVHVRVCPGLHTALCLLTQDCPPGSTEFRELQCKAFDDKSLVAGSSYRWTTFHGGQ